MTTSRRRFLASSAALGLASQLSATESPTGMAKNTKFACNVEMWFSREKNFLKRLEGAAALGFPGVEIWPYENKDIAAVADTCERLKLTIAQFTAWGFKPGMNDPKNKQKVVDKGAGGIEYLMKKNKVTVFRGVGKIAGKGKVEFTASEGGAKSVIETKNIIIATGSVVTTLPSITLDHKRILSSDSILELPVIPKSIIVLGAGAVGTEFASMTSPASTAAHAAAHAARITSTRASTPVPAVRASSRRPSTTRAAASRHVHQPSGPWTGSGCATSRDRRSAPM